MKPITGLPDDAISAVVEAVEDILDDTSVKKFYIGRTNETEKTRSELGADDIVPVYRTYRPKNTMDVERSLIDVFSKDPRCTKKAKHEGGDVSPDEVQYVYIALWLKS